MTNASGTEAVLRNYVKAVEDGDVQTISDLFAEDAMWRLDAGDLPISGTWIGRDRIMNDFLTNAMSHYEPGTVELEITGLIASGDQAVLQWTSRARTRTGRPYENGCIGVFTIREGKIQAVREYMDTLYAGNIAFGTS